LLKVNDRATLIARADEIIELHSKIKSPACRAIWYELQSRYSIGREIFMIGRSLRMHAAAALTVLMLSAMTADAAELKVFTSVALTDALGELAPVFEQKTGNKLTISYDLAAVQKKRILDGERADVIILTRAMMDDLAGQNKLAPGNIVNVASTPVALAVRAGAAKPDISSADAFRQTLLSAKSIAYADPAKGGLSGVVASRAIDRLGIAEQMKPKTTLVPGAQSPDLVAKGEVELGIAQASEIVPNAGVQLAGALPGELGSITRFSGGIGAGSPSADAAKALIDFLAGPEAGSRFKAKGFEPGG
jgi:molybdate transport system substrate-binding protein